MQKRVWQFVFHVALIILNVNGCHGAASSVDMFSCQGILNIVAGRVVGKQPCRPYVCMQYSSCDAKMNALSSSIITNFFQGKDGYRRLLFSAEHFVTGAGITMLCCALLNLNKDIRQVKNPAYQAIEEPVAKLFRAICRVDFSDYD